MCAHVYMHTYTYMYVLGGCRGVLGGCRGVLGGCWGVLGGCRGVLGGCWGVLGGCLGVQIISQADHGAQRVTMIGRTRLPPVHLRPRA